MADVRGYVAIFGGLMVLTLATVTIATLSLPTGVAVALGLLVASVKAALVVMFFMHLKGERPLVLWPLALTAFLCLFLIIFVLWSESDHVQTAGYRLPATAEFLPTS
jgi:caa(3)-type oxidase subunit IV